MANIRISELQSAPLISGSYVFPASNNNTTNKITFDQLYDWINTREIKNQSINYSVTKFDTKTIVTFTNNEPVLFSISNVANQLLPIGSTLEIIRLGSGIVNVAGDTNVIVNSSIGWTLRDIYSKATVSKINGNT